MSLNSSTTASKPYLKYLALFGALYILYYLSMLLFLWYPEIFYVRSWEYYRDIVYHQKEKRLWSGYEQGDYSLSLLSGLSAEGRKTQVSCDSDGYRSVPLQSEAYPLLIVGDCNIWGVNLSDEETLPWKLAEITKLPVFNGGRTPGAAHPYLLASLLNHSHLKECQIIVEFVRDSVIDENLFIEPFKKEPFKGFIKEEAFFLKNPPLKRYFIPLKLINHAKYLFNCFTASWDKEGLPQETYVPHRKLEIVVDHIKKRAQYLQDLGYRYIFVPLPSRDYVLAKKIIGKSPAAQNQLLVTALSQKGVECLDLYPDFNSNKRLFVEKDTHISPVATSLIASRLAQYLEGTKS